MFYLDGIFVILMVIIDEKGNIGIMEMIDNKWIEWFVCVIMVEMGVSFFVSLYLCNGV